jgi:AraC-like DNA-binding protein
VKVRHGLTTSSRLPAKSPLANTALIARLVWSCGGNSISAFLNQKLGQKPDSTNTPVVGVTIVKPVEPSVTLRALLSRLASELGVSEDYLSLGLRISRGTDPKQFARIARTEKVRQAMGETSASKGSPDRDRRELQE